MPETESKNQFKPKENLPLPRILLLDFDDDVKEKLEGEGYTVFTGSTGFSSREFSLPIHESELEIILWNASEISASGIIKAHGTELNINTHAGTELFEQIIRILKRYFERMREKDGFVGIFLGNQLLAIINSNLSELLASEFSFGKRNTTTLVLNKKEDDVWYQFFDKGFIPEKNILFSIDWRDNLVNFNRYFEDEDDNIYAVAYRHFAIIPKIEKEKISDAIIFLLQEVLPREFPDIFPEKYFFTWANQNIYHTLKLISLKENKRQIIEQYNSDIQNINEEIRKEEADSEYLSKLLISDDSSLFAEGNRLSDHVHSLLENDLGFKVTNVDKLRLAVGASLKEDKWIEDSDDYFALVEVKGTEKGAKANWVRQDLNAHIREFEVVKGMSGLKSLLIFNHDRREEPAKRSDPFQSDKELIQYCEKSEICLIPVYELFKLAVAIKNSKLTPEEGRKLIKEARGLLALNLQV